MSSTSFETQPTVNLLDRPAKLFRPIHYLGSKLRLLHEIGEAVKDVGGSSGIACDLFSGSGVVSSFLGASHRVVAVDIQEYARVLASTMLDPNEVDQRELVPLVAPTMTDPLGERLLWAFEPLIRQEQERAELARQGDPGPLADFIEVGSLVAYEQGTSADGAMKVAFEKAQARLHKLEPAHQRAGLVTKYYGGSYFSYEHAAALDVLLSRAARLPSELNDLGKAIALSTASELVRTVGKQFAQPLRPKDKRGAPKPTLWRIIDRSSALDPRTVIKTQVGTYLAKPKIVPGCEAIRADYRDFLLSSNQDIDVVYADPPYTRDHYSRFYHVLETMCLQDSPTLSKTNLNGGQSISRGAYREDRHQSPFCIRSQAPAAFDELFRLTRERGASLVLSYSPQSKGDRIHPRVMHMEDVQRIAKKYYKAIELRRISSVVHSKLNRTDLHLETPDQAEVLLVCKA